MGKPTESELQQAVSAAIAMRESGQDEDYMAKTLLNLNYRVQKLEHVLTATRRYLHAGQSVSDHRHLLQAIQAAEKASASPDEDDLPILGQPLSRAR
ncbi:MAG TPA: hypothetical protein VF050_11485 [Moraxellaceae bacterium]